MVVVGFVLVQYDESRRLRRGYCCCGCGGGLCSGGSVVSLMDFVGRTDLWWYSGNCHGGRMLTQWCDVFFICAWCTHKKNVRTLSTCLIAPVQFCVELHCLLMTGTTKVITRTTVDPKWKSGEGLFTTQVMTSKVLFTTQVTTYEVLLTTQVTTLTTQWRPKWRHLTTF